MHLKIRLTYVKKTFISSLQMALACNDDKAISWEFKAQNPTTKDIYRLT